MPETWTRKFDSIMDCYIPGDTMPPIKDEWRYRYERTHYKVMITGCGEKPKKYAPMKSDMRPVISGNSVGIATGMYTDTPRWLFFTFSELSIEKYLVKTRYRLVSDDDDGTVVEYMDDEPILVAEDGDW